MSSWKAVKGFESIYQVSTHGEVKSLKRRITYQNGTKRDISEKILKPKDNGQGYKFVSLSYKNIRYNCYIHRLVAETFIHNENKLPFVNHIDGVPENNTVENLEWVTHSQNIQHAYSIGLIRKVSSLQAA